MMGGLGAFHAWVQDTRTPYDLYHITLIILRRVQNSSSGYIRREVSGQLQTPCGAVCSRSGASFGHRTSCIKVCRSTHHFETLDAEWVPPLLPIDVGVQVPYLVIIFMPIYKGL